MRLCNNHIIGASFVKLLSMHRHNKRGALRLIFATTPWDYPARNRPSGYIATPPMELLACWKEGKGTAKEEGHSAFLRKKRGNSRKRDILFSAEEPRAQRFSGPASPVFGARAGRSCRLKCRTASPRGAGRRACRARWG